MVEKGKGKVIFPSVPGLTTSGFLDPYNASKQALEAIGQCLREELKPLGFTVVTINPESFDNGFNDRMYDTYKQWFDEDLQYTSIKEIEKAAELMAEKQFDPKEMIDKMVELILLEEHNFRTVCPENFEDMCQKYHSRQYKIKTKEIDNSKK